MHNGRPCKQTVTEPCLPDVCYSAESEKFGAKKIGMRPLRTLPPQHPAFTRTTCGGPLTASDWIPAADANQALECTGPTLFYAHDPTTGKTGATSMVTGKDDVSQIFFMQDSNAQLYFGMMNGRPKSGVARMDIEMKFTGIAAQNNGV